MSQTLIYLRFAVKSEVVSPSRYGIESTMVLDASVFDPLTIHVAKKRRFSHSERRVATRVSGRYRTGRITTPYVGGEQNRLYWTEFYESVCNDEVFEVDALEFWGVNEVFDAFLLQDTFELPRIQTLNAYRITLDFRVVEY